MTSDISPAPRRVGVLTHLGGLTQLAAIGIGGTIAFSILIGLLSTGLSMVLIGVGLFFLLAFVYGLFVLAWVEYQRTAGLYPFAIPTLRAARSGRPGFTGWLRTVWLQFIDGAMWRGVASAAIATVLGLVLWATVGGIGAGVGMLFSPLRGTTATLPLLRVEISSGLSIAFGAIGIIVGLAVLVGIAALQAVLLRAVLVPSREAVLAAQARAAGQQREGAVRAGEVERTRIERDLHDGVQPRLVSVAMTLGLAQQKLDTDPSVAKELIDEAHTSTKAAITELRQLARGIHASVLDDRGLDAALSALASRSPIPVELDVRLDGRCSSTAEAAVYFAVAESLTNAAKHSRGSQARVTVRRRDEDGVTRVWGRVEDNGLGGARVLPGGGLDGISNRVLAAGGTVRIDSPIGGPTALEVSVPCAS